MSCTAPTPRNHLEQQHNLCVTFVVRYPPKGLNLMTKELLLLGQGLGTKSAALPHIVGMHLDSGPCSPDLPVWLDLARPPVIMVDELAPDQRACTYS